MRPIWKPICNKPCGGRWPESGSRPVQGRWPDEAPGSNWPEGD